MDSGAVMWLSLPKRYLVPRRSLRLMARWQVSWLGDHPVRRAFTP